MAQQKHTLLIALSGASSSGKTTIARLLHRTIFPPDTTVLLHLDDFYLPEAQLPIRNGLVDWDSAASLDLVLLQKVLLHIQQHGTIPSDFVSKEDGNTVGAVPIEEDTISRLTSDVRAWWNVAKLEERVSRIVIVDGFLLLGQSIPAIRDAFDIRILLRARLADARARREKRSGYVTLEGWWEDPPGYMDQIVWPAYVEEHGYLFVDGDVEGEVDKETVGRLDIKVGPEQGLDDMLDWVMDIIKHGIEMRIGNA